MSQSGPLRASSGSTPPAGEISFVTDNGTATTVSDILNVNGNSSTVNNNDGLQTRANPNGSNNLEIYLTNRLVGSVTTNGATTGNIISFTPTAIGSYTIECRISGFNTTSTLSAGYSLFFTARFDGTNSTIIDIVDKITNEEGAMTAANSTATASGAVINIQGIGYTGQTINWAAVGLYTYVGA